MNEGEISAGMAGTPSYRYADRVGRRLYVSGQVPLDGSGELVGTGDAAKQATQCLNNLSLLLKHHDFGKEDIRRLVVYVAGSRDEMTATWDRVVEWFGGAVPPATLLGVTLLGYEGQLVEIDANIDANSDLDDHAEPDK